MAYEHFEKLPPEKRRAIVNAGFACFGRDGYQKTAMSEIAAAAGVSKAALFHYFGTKEEMFFYLYRFSCDEISGGLPQGGADFFECIALGTQAKLRVMEQYPGMNDFLLEVVKSSDLETEAILRRANARAIDDSVRKLFSAVDWSRLKPEVSPADAMAMTRWVNDGYIRDNTNTPPDEMAVALQRYLGLLKRAIYKEECL